MFQKTLNLILDKSDPMTIKNTILSIKDEAVQNRLIAIWACEFGFNELTPELDVKRPYVPIDKFNTMSAAEREEFKAQKDKYLEDSHSLKTRNESNYIWLNKYLSYLTNEDTEYKVKINSRLDSFRRFFSGIPNKTINPKPEQERVAKYFGGEVVDDEGEWDE